MTAKNVFTAGTDIVASTMNENFATLPWTMQAGTASATMTSGSPWSTGTVAVTLAASRFTQAPLVTATVNASSTAVLNAQVQSITTSGFTIRVQIYASSTASLPVSWIAVQQQSGSASG